MHLLLVLPWPACLKGRCAFVLFANKQNKQTKKKTTTTTSTPPAGFRTVAVSAKRCQTRCWEVAAITACRGIASFAFCDLGFWMMVSQTGKPDKNTSPPRTNPELLTRWVGSITGGLWRGDRQENTVVFRAPGDAGVGWARAGCAAPK